MVKWLEHIENNNYRCTKCGANLIKEDGYHDEKSITEINKIFYCYKCGSKVAEIVDVSRL